MTRTVRGRNTNAWPDGPVSPPIFRSPSPLAVRHEREHQRPAAPVLPERQQPIRILVGPTRCRRLATQRPTSQKLRLEMSRRTLQTKKPQLRRPLASTCCTSILKPPVHSCTRLAIKIPKSYNWRTRYSFSSKNPLLPCTLFSWVAHDGLDVYLIGLHRRGHRRFDRRWRRVVDDAIAGPSVRHSPGNGSGNRSAVRGDHQSRWHGGSFP